MNYNSRGFEPTREIRKERFEFELTVNGNIICQRYFKINNFNEASVMSVEFMDSVRRCVKLIQDNLRNKTCVYTYHNSPFVFDSEEQMKEWFGNEDNIKVFDVHYGAWAVVRGKSGHEYVWLGEDGFRDEGVRTDYNEFVDSEDVEQDTVFRFAVIDNGRDWFKSPSHRVIGEMQFDGNVYPKFIRNGVDISNVRGRYDDMDISKLSHDASLYYWCNIGQQDLVPVIIREICETCSSESDSDYTFKMPYGEKVYNNLGERYSRSQERRHGGEFSKKNKQ